MKKLKTNALSISFLLTFIAGYYSKAQTTLVIQPDAAAGKDVCIDSYYPTSPGPNVAEFNSAIWTHGGLPEDERGMVEFNLSAVPAGATIISASLTLYNNRNSANGQQNGQHYGSNASVLQRIITPWQENTVCWNNQPATTNVNEAVLPASTNVNQDYTVNVTLLIQDMIANPSTSFGFMLKQQIESTYRCLLFCSSDDPNPALRPKLQITYTTACVIPNVLFLKPGPTEGKDVCVDSYYPTSPGPNVPELNSQSWTHGGQPEDERGLLEFNLSGIPAGATITSATLKLFNNPNSSNGYQNGQHAGSNASVLQRIITPWLENTVCWNNQPSTTNANEVVLPESNNVNQDYIANVTALIKDMIANPSSSYGFMLKQQIETPYRCLLFASSDDPDNTKWPQLTINYFVPVTAAIAPAGSVSVCAGSTTALTATPGAGYTYKWYRNNILLSTTTQTLITGTGGTYKCVVKAGTCSATSNSVVVTQINNPTPTITASGPTTFCNGSSVTLTANTFTGVTYQWQKNAVNIPGATGQSYVATSTGSYRANETKSGCSKFTSKKNVKVNNCARLGNETSDELEANDANNIAIEAFPNPFKENLSVAIKSSTTEQTEINILDVLGKIQYKQMVNTNETNELNVKLSPGIYIITAVVDGEMKKIRVIKGQ